MHRSILVYYHLHLFLLLRHAESLEFCPGLLEVVVDDDLVENTRSLCEFELVLGLCETLGDGVFGISGAAAQTGLEDFDGWWLEGEVAGVEAGLLYLLDTL